jgi:hypothetical protein
MDRRSVLGTMSGLVLGAVLGFWWRGSPPEASPPREPPAQIILPPPAVTAASPEPELELPVREPEPALPEPAGPYERALRVVADYSGEGVVRCPVGDALPEGEVVGISRARVEDGVLVGSVEEPSGRARILLPGDPRSAAPRLVLRWWDAWPGDAGSCELLVPEQVLVTGRVVDGQGRGVVAEVGNAVDGTVATAPDGTFVARCWRGAECPLAARREMGKPWGPFETLVVEGPSLDGIELRLDEAPHRDLRAYLEDEVAENERLAKQPDPLRLALSDPELPAEARALIEAWLDEQAEARAIAKNLLADVE